MWLKRFLCLCSLFVVACGPADRSSVLPTEESGYPAATESSLEAYPSVEANAQTLSASTANPGGYPAPVQESVDFEDPRFRIERPLKVGESTVLGQAPPNLHLAVVDITFNGVVLGTGYSDKEGLFAISVSPLPEGHRIGITLAELAPDQTFDEMATKYFPHRGDEFMNIPNVGIFFDTAMTNP